MNAQTILVPVDFSDVTERTIEAARALAGVFKGRIVLLHVVEPEPDFIGFEPGPQPVRSAAIETLQVAQEQLQVQKAQLAASGIEVSAFDLQGPVVEKILELAQSEAADLIVIGSHGHGALYNLLVGSVTGGVLKSAPCPVLVIPARA